MFRHRPNARPPTARRCGLTLLELLLASSIMVLFAATISALAVAVQQNTQYNDGVATATQHARVAIARIERAVRQSTANQSFPGCVAIADRVGSDDLPDTLVVWRGDISVADPDGSPLLGELAIYCPDPKSPNRLLEITVPGDRRATPPLANAWAWYNLVAKIKADARSRKTELTDRLRAPVVNRSAGRRGAIRFDVMFRPSDDALARYEAGSLAWDELRWAQGIHSDVTGLRQTWCAIELQLRGDAAEDGSETTAIPFLGSAARYFALRRG